MSMQRHILRDHLVAAAALSALPLSTWAGGIPTTVLEEVTVTGRLDRLQGTPLAFASLCLAIGGTVHALAFPKAATAADHSTLPMFYSAAFKGLWLSDSIACVVLALAFGSVAVFPGLASRTLVVLLALAPLALATAIFATMGNFFAGHLMLLAGTAALIGGTMHRCAAQQPSGTGTLPSGERQ